MCQSRQGTFLALLLTWGWIFSQRCSEVWQSFQSNLAVGDCSWTCRPVTKQCIDFHSDAGGGNIGNGINTWQAELLIIVSQNFSLHSLWLCHGAKIRLSSAILRGIHQKFDFRKFHKLSLFRNVTMKISRTGRQSLGYLYFQQSRTHICWHNCSPNADYSKKWWEHCGTLTLIWSDVDRLTQYLPNWADGHIPNCFHWCWQGGKKDEQQKYKETGSIYLTVTLSNWYVTSV